MRSAALASSARLRACSPLWSRHTLAVYLCQQQGLGSLRFADLTP